MKAGVKFNKIHARFLQAPTSTNFMFALAPDNWLE
jgi:hypothetical protein